MRSTSALFTPLTVRGITARNRIMVSPMCMYAAADGLAVDFHLVHLGRFALGGAGIVVAEATAVAPEGRISSRDLGLWRDDQERALVPIVNLLRARGAVPGIQLAHAGRKASCTAPWDGGTPLTAADAIAGDPPWQVVGPSALPAGAGWPTPHEMSTEDIAASVQDWRAAAERAQRAGFGAVELHGAHGYLLHSFLSPISNRRHDEYGGSLRHRMRYPLEVARAAREAFDGILLYRVSSIDGVEGGLTIDDTVEFARALEAVGVDVIDTSSGGIVTDRHVDTRVRRGFGFHTPFSAALKARTDLIVATVGLITDPHQAEAILRRADADIVALGREMLADPHWPHRARAALEGESYDEWHVEAGYFLTLRQATLRRLRAAGETPSES